MTDSKPNKFHIITAVAVIRRNDGRILLLKRHDSEKVYPGYFTFPGGKSENNETMFQTLEKEVKEECNLDLEPGMILIKEKAIGRPDGSTSKSLSFLCTVKSYADLKIDENDFTEYQWVNLDELHTLKHVGLVAEFEKTENIYSSGCDVSIFFTDTDQVDFRKE